MAVQYTLTFPHEPDFSAQALIPHAGLEAAQAWLHAGAAWPTTTLILSGPAASGKSHLTALVDFPVLVHDLCEAPLEDGNRAANLFHQINECQAHGRRLLILSRVRPAAIYPALPDLDSRLKAASHARLKEPKDDAVRQAILFKIGTDHQLQFDLDTAQYIVTRLPQTLAALRAFCALAAQEHPKSRLSKIAAGTLIERLETP